MRTPPQFAAQSLPTLERELLTPSEAANFLSISVHTLHYWRKRKVQSGPRYFKVHSHAIRYRVLDLEGFLKGRAVRPARKS